MGRRLSVAEIAAALILMLTGSTVTLTLLGLRVDRTGLPHFGFLAWNLLLAWVPMLLALTIFGLHRLCAPNVVLLALAAPWLLFLPNAPYLATDVVHLRTTWGGVPLWFDTLLVCSAGATGVLLGYGAVYTVQVVVAQRKSVAMGWAVAFVSLGLSAVGVYVGRYLRFNSWDAILDPYPLLDRMFTRLADPLGNEFLLLAVAVFSVLLVAGYLIIIVAAQTASHAARRNLARIR
ncbi:MAG: DUF1361 domain-containing protein [Hyphomicrobiales bacterium]